MMREYHKINTIFKREESGKHRIMEGQYSLPEFEYLKDNRWVFTEKVDGTNVRVMWDGENVTFNGKTDNAQMPMPLVYKLQELFEGTHRREAMKKVLTGPACLYGEGYGAKIQKGGGNYKADGTDFVLFDILAGDVWLERSKVADIALQLGVRAVPVIGKGTLADAVEMTRKGFNSLWGDFKAEGIVLRPECELVNRLGHRIITKIKYRDFI